MNEFFEQLGKSAPEEWLLLFLIYSFAACTYGVIYCVRINMWPSVFGDLVDSEIERLSPSMQISDQNYSAMVKYHYEVDGVEHTGHRLTPFVAVVSHNFRFFLRLQMTYIETRADGKIRVYYNPRKPQKSYLIAPGIIGYTFIASFVLIPSVLYYIVATS